jgi:hypothetical protein
LVVVTPRIVHPNPVGTPTPNLNFPQSFIDSGVPSRAKPGASK